MTSKIVKAASVASVLAVSLMALPGNALANCDRWSAMIVSYKRTVD